MTSGKSWCRNWSWSPLGTRKLSNRAERVCSLCLGLSYLYLKLHRCLVSRVLPTWTYGPHKVINWWKVIVFCIMVSQKNQGVTCFCCLLYNKVAERDRTLTWSEIKSQQIKSFIGIINLASSAHLPKGLYILRRVWDVSEYISVIVSQIITKFDECVG